MPGWGLSLGHLAETVGVGTSAGTALSVPGANNTKGSYAQLTAATMRPADGMIVQLSMSSASPQRDQLVDIAVGAAGAEQIILPDLMICGGAANQFGWATYYFPIPVPVGSRIAGRYQSTSASGTTVAAIVRLIAPQFSSPPPFSRVTAYGANAADSGGVSVDPGGSANTKGGWTEIVASTSRPLRALSLAIGNQANSARTDANYLIDLAIGPAGSEQIVVADQYANASAAYDLPVPRVTPLLPVSTIPSGTRLAARILSTTNDATDRLLDLIVYGVD